MNSAPSGRSSGHIPLWLLASLCIGLSACGGSGGDTGNATTTDRADDSMAQESAPAPSAWLNAQSLEAAERQARATSPASAPLDSLAVGQIAAWDDYISGEVVRKAAALRIPVYRFYNTQTTAHFYTTSETEKANILATMPHFHLDGTAFHGASAFSPGLSPVYRFYNSQTGVHFYTISESEKANILATMPQFALEGPAYYASQVSGQGLTPLYRFYLPAKGFHFYTASSTERDSIIANLASSYIYEGVGYHVLASNWTAEILPHTGLLVTQCYRAGSDALTPCDEDPSTDLNSQQDGHRRAINPMSYAAVTNPSGGNHALTQCVRDTVTGLVWEGKTDDGTYRDQDARFTHLNNNQSGDTSRYIADTNASQLCGFNDWRLPTVQELQGLVTFGSTTSPRIDGTWLPHTAAAGYWSSEYWSGNTTYAWYVQFAGNGGWTHNTQRSNTMAVRLVRGSAPASARYTYTTRPYGSDGANNVVNDAWTGLQWRRCEQGRTWNGTICTGTASTFSHEAALSHAHAQSGWRLPNVRELASLLRLDTNTGARLDATAFPAALNATLHSTTAVVDFPVSVWGVDFDQGYVSYDSRSTARPIRLVLRP